MLFFPCKSKHRLDAPIARTHLEHPKIFTTYSQTLYSNLYTIICLNLFLTLVNLVFLAPPKSLQNHISLLFHSTSGLTWWYTLPNLQSSLHKSILSTHHVRNIGIYNVKETSVENFKHLVGSQHTSAEWVLPSRCLQPSRGTCITHVSSSCELLKKTKSPTLSNH